MRPGLAEKYSQYLERLFEYKALSEEDILGVFQFQQCGIILSDIRNDEC